MPRLSSISILLLVCVCNDRVEIAKARFIFREKLQIPLLQRYNKRHNSAQALELISPKPYPLHGGHQEETTDQAQDEGSQQEFASHEENSAPEMTNSNDTQQKSQTSQHPRRQGLFGTRPKFKTPYRRQVAAVKNRFQDRLDHIRSSANSLFRDGPGNNGASGPEQQKERLLSALGPSVLAFWTNRGGSADPSRLLSFGTVYALSLLGSSVGFYSFLYFISVGYALGITLPLMVALRAYQQQVRSMASVSMPQGIGGMSTFLHCGLVILWGIRAFTFFLWREYVNWPALHKQIRYVNESDAPTLPVKCLIWFMYSFLYTAMLSPCWFRLQQSARIRSTITSTLMTPSTRKFNPLVGLGSYFPLVLQLIGLVMESVADYQKSTFKFDNRYEWCNVGLWKWSTHPNYLGEMIFWTGTYLGWILFAAMVYSNTSVKNPSLLSWLGQFAFTSLGYVFIITVLRGSLRSMSQKHWQKYGHIPEYAVFRQSHGLLGPKRHHYNQTVVEDANATTTEQVASNLPQ